MNQNNPEAIYITPKRLNSPYLFRIMLGFFSRRSRPVRRTENYFAQIWNQRIQGLKYAWKEICIFINVS